MNKRWENKLPFPLAKLGERYQREDFGIVLECSADQGKVGGGQRFSFTVLYEGLDNRRINIRDLDSSDRVDNCQFPMLVESVHVVNDANGIVFRVVPSFIRLQIQNERKDTWVCNSLYLSFVSGKFLFINGLLSKDREFNGVLMVNPIVGVGEMPCNMVEARSQVMDDFPAQNTKAQRDGQFFEIINRILPFLRVYIGEDWVFATVKENPDFTVQIDDVLIGPF